MGWAVVFASLLGVALLARSALRQAHRRPRIRGRTRDPVRSLLERKGSPTLSDEERHELMRQLDQDNRMHSPSRRPG